MGKKEINLGGNTRPTEREREKKTWFPGLGYIVSCDTKKLVLYCLTKTYYKSLKYY